MSSSPAPYFFMSYSREDTAKQRRIVRELRERGINVWVDIENLTPGTPTWEREVERAIRNATGLIVLLSPESNNSEWVRREIGFGEQHRKRIFPVLIEGDDDTSTPLRLVSHQRVDLRRHFEQGLDQLADAIKDYIGVKEEINTQIKEADERKTTVKPPLDLKKFATPAVLAMIGLVLIGGIATAVNVTINNNKSKPVIVTASPPNNVVDIVTGTATEPLTATATEPVTAKKTEPTGKIVFTCQIQGDEICAINADGSGWQRLTGTAFANSNASPSPDGRKAVFVRNDGKNSEIFELDLASGNTKQLTNLKKNLGAPEISPDNKYIIFHYNPGGNLQLWIMNRDGSKPREFYSVSGRDVHDPTWSPDGTQILFALGRGDNNQLYIMDFDGTNPRLVSDAIDTRGRSDWSVNNLISFDQGDPFLHDVFVMNVDGSGLRQVSQGNNSQGASLSPDGEWIAFTAYTANARQNPGSCEIFIIRVDGSDIRQLTDNSYCDYQPRWGN
jgi:hypothetical protein